MSRLFVGFVAGVAACAVLAGWLVWSDVHEAAS
jgi:hypothetical protein